MKKGISLLVISVLLFGALISPVLAAGTGSDAGQGQTQESKGLVELGGIEKPNTCKIRHDITVLGDKFEECKVGENMSYDEYAHCCLVDRILTFIDWFFWALIIISFFMLLIGAFNILTAGGNPDKVALGRKYLMFASIGLVLALLAFIIPRMILRVIL
ncbi:hypothetical protein J7K92_01585 [bacterium]|nr:hypothetical protein [bacterium]